MKQERSQPWASMVVLVLLSLVFGTGCSKKVQEIPGTGPVERFKKQAHWIYVYAKPDVARDSLYATALLSPFTPGHPLSEAIGLFGEPKTQVPEERGARYLIYETTNGIIKLGAETDANDHAGYPMYFAPNNRRPVAFFCEAIVKQIDSNAAKQIVMLFEPGYAQPFLHARIEYGQVHEVVLMDRPMPK